MSLNKQSGKDILSGKPLLVFDSRELPIDKVEVMRYLGYRKKFVRHEVVEELVEEEIQEARRLIMPQAVYMRQSVKSLQNGIITFTNGFHLNVGDASGEWKGCQYVGIGLCTIGMGVEDKVDELFPRQENLSALILDVVGSVAVEAIVNEVNFLVCHGEQKEGNVLGPRVSPGYGKWQLTDQKVIFSLLPISQIGVMLNEQCMMIPRKSCSFCLGIGAALEHQYNPCRRCGKVGCDMRWSTKKERHSGK